MVSTFCCSEIASDFASIPGANTYTVTASAVPATLTAGNVPGGRERMPPAHGVPPARNSSSSCSRRWNSRNRGAWMFPKLEIMVYLRWSRILTAGKLGVVVAASRGRLADPHGDEAPLILAPG